jgi:hypothetical protein
MKYLVFILLLASCGDKQTVQLIPGPKGESGSTGNTGSDAIGTVMLQRSASNTECLVTSGTAVDFYKDNDNSLDVSLGDTLSSTLVSCNGRDGEDGESIVGPVGPMGPSGLNGTTFEIVQLCPSLSGSYPEVLFKIGGRLYAHFDGGANLDRLVLLPNGTYSTTDGRNCVFTVSGGNVL